MKPASRSISVLPSPAGDRRQSLRSALTLVWTISPAAMVAAPGADALLNGHAATLSGAELHVRVSPAGNLTADLLLKVRSGKADRLPLELPGGSLASLLIDDRLGMLHIDAPGLLSATLELSDDQDPKLAFARTALLYDALHLVGGTYDAPRMAVDSRA